jgi:type III pantothenate kinase
MLLTIDVGNTATGIAVFYKGQLVFMNKLMTPDEVSRYYLKSLVKRKYRLEVKDIIVSSVVPFVDESLRMSIKEYFGKEAIFIDHSTADDVGLKLKIDIPEELGADRIADTIGALHFFDPPFIIIDSGTATTFDVVSKDMEYLGGCIFPGIELSINSLAQHAAKLGRVHFQVPKSIMGTNTESHIVTGIYHCYVGGLSYMIEEYKKIIGNNAKVIATGGLVRYFESKIKGIDLFEPNLIYYGLKKIYEMIKGYK